MRNQHNNGASRRRRKQRWGRRRGGRRRLRGGCSDPRPSGRRRRFLQRGRLQLRFCGGLRRWELGWSAFLSQSGSSRSLGHEIKLLRHVFAISSWSSCSALSSHRRPNHSRAHLATVVPPPTRPSSRNPHSPSDNAAVTSARVVAASSEAPESLPLTVAAIFGLKSSGTPQWWIFNYLHSWSLNLLVLLALALSLLKLQRYPFKSTLYFQLYITDPSYLQNGPLPLDGSQIGHEL
ncbi:hypothetical protein F2Q69_00056897 [Brassica cretica]|uniref:Uncharacterized protein n=1 Tax=Brassica cretica TaxID=69181 RepID=A0A8S9MQG4_BRACR|nr:hypothetical protein F2Q69_00056897 [Brassica cretica]